MASVLALPRNLKSPAVQFPVPVAAHPEGSLSALFRQSFLQAKRLLLVLSRDPLTMVQAVVYPALMLLILRIVLGDSISKFTGASSIYGTVPMMTLTSAMFGSMASAVMILRERQSGLLSRFWAMPIHRAADLIGRLIAEGVRIVLTTLLILAVGVALGFRFSQGIGSFFGILALPLLFGLGFATFVTAAALMSSKTTLIEIIALITTLSMFFNSGFVPVVAYPGWLQPIVENQPMTQAIEAMRALALGGDVAGPLTNSILWSVGLILVFIYPAMRGYRKSATGSL